MTDNEIIEPTAHDILAGGGLTDEQIAQGRLANVATSMAHDMWLAQLLIKAGIEEMRRLIPDVTGDVVKEWARATLATARRELVRK